MKGYRKILIAVNGSDAPLRYGLRIATDERTWITVVKVIPPYEGDLELVGIKDIGSLLESEGSRFHSEINDIANTERVAIKARVEEGNAHEKIIEVACQERCDVIVMGAPRKSPLRRFFGDNVVEKVIRHAPCPVLVV